MLLGPGKFGRGVGAVGSGADAGAGTEFLN